LRPAALSTSLAAAAAGRAGAVIFRYEYLRRRAGGLQRSARHGGVL